MSKSTTIVTTTTALSAIADDIRAQMEANGLPSKQSLLNTFARGIVGSRFDWGFLTQSKSAILQMNIPAARLRDLPLSPVSLRDLRPRGDGAPAVPPVPRVGPQIKIQAQAVDLYDAETSDFLAESFQGETLCISEIFSNDSDITDDVQCMFDPRLIVADAKTGFQARPLWGASVEIAKTGGPAYFAASSSQDVNDLVNGAIESTLEADTSEFRVFYMPHAVIVMPDYPVDISYDLDDEDGLAEAMSEQFVVFVSRGLTAQRGVEVRAQVADLLARVMQFHDMGDELTNFDIR